MSWKKIYPVVFGISLAAFTAYISLDTFLIPDVYSKVDENTSFVFQTVTSSEIKKKPDNTEKSDKTITTSAKNHVTSQSTQSNSSVTSVPSTTNSEKNSSSDKKNNPQDNKNSDQTAGSNSSDTDIQTQSPQNNSQTQANTPSEPVITENTYSDENIQINITPYRECDTDIYVADISVSSLEYLKAALAENSYGKNITAKTSETAANVNAIFAVNGDFYGARESGYVIRNGVLYREDASDDRQDLVIWADGSFQIINEDNISARQLYDNRAYQVFSFGPGLVSDGQITVSEYDEVNQAMSSNPRTAIGILGTNHFIFVVSDGRTNKSAGLSLYQLAGFMKDLGASAAYNLDGGGSSAMYFNGKIINNPTTDGRKIKERSVSDIVYIGY